MHMVPEVSVIIPVFQNQVGLERCLKFLAQQHGLDMSALEVLVVDNGSEPRIRIPPSLPYSISLSVCKKAGAYAARNAGVRMASGKVLAFLDADCWPDSGWIISGLRALEQDGNDKVVGGNVLFERSPRPSIVESYQILMGFGQEHSVTELQFSATANLFVTRQVFEKVGEFNESLLSGGDREWCWRAGRMGLPVLFSKDAFVWTEPRRTLKSALVQARRVAGGRKGLESDSDILATVGPSKIQPKKGFLRKCKTILSAKQFPLTRRLQIFCVAMIIRCVHDFEAVRIKLGAEPERR